MRKKYSWEQMDATKAVRSKKPLFFYTVGDSNSFFAYQKHFLNYKFFEKLDIFFVLCSDLSAFHLQPIVWKTSMVKSSFSKKATKIWKKFPLVLTILSKDSCFVKSGGRFFQNVAFSFLNARTNDKNLLQNKGRTKHFWDRLLS